MLLREPGDLAYTARRMQQSKTPPEPPCRAPFLQLVCAAIAPSPFRSQSDARERTDGKRPHLPDVCHRRDEALGSRLRRCPKRLTIDELTRECEQVAKLGIPAVALFPNVDRNLRTDDGAKRITPTVWFHAPWRPSKQQSGVGRHHRCGPRSVYEPRARRNLGRQRLHRQ